MNRKVRMILIVVLILAVGTAVSGCRESLVLTKILHDQHAQEQDTKSDTRVAKNNKDSNVKDKNLTRKKDSESDKNSRVKKEAAKAGDKKNTGSANKTRQDSNSSNNNKSDSSNNGNGTNNNKNGNSGNNGNDGSSADGDGSAGANGDRQIYDDSGNLVDLPENVDSVAAAGNAAIMVQMLGGKGIVTGTSASVADNSLAQTVFSDESLGAAKTYWSGTGSQPMSSSSFSALLKAKPDVCIGSGGQNNFSSSQISQLKSKKIAYVTIPAFNTADNIEKAATILGNMIGNRSSKGGVNAKKQASKYIDYCDELTGDVKSTCGLFTWNNRDFNNDYSANGGPKSAKGATSRGKYSLYISGWDSSAFFSLSASGDTVYSENGMAITPNGYSGAPVSYYMSVAGVCNNAARFSEENCKKYAAIPLNINVLKPTVSSSSVSYYKPTNESFARYWTNDDSDGIGLGSSKFPAVVVDSSSTRAHIKSSGMWKNYGKVTLGSRTDYGFINDGTMVTTYIRGNYDVLVNPYGVTSWADGSAESVLESIWTGWKISGKYSEDSVRNEIKKFYSEFYRYDLSSSQIDSIIEGK